MVAIIALVNTKISINHDLFIKTSREVKQQLMVCSHERSGTHFTMNTMASVSHYCSQPWLNYDLFPLGASINFFSERSARKFITDFSSLKINGDATCNASIIKSHFPLSHLGDKASALPLKIIYIWRDPAETIASLWKFIHNWNWNEGPKTRTAMELASTRPSGQSQRYQKSNYRDYFERWAEHTLDGLSQCKKNPKARCISYRELLTNHTSTTENLCRDLNIKLLQKPRIPSKSENTIKGASVDLNSEDMARLRDFCDERVEDYPELKALLKKDF